MTLTFEVLLFNRGTFLPVLEKVRFRSRIPEKNAFVSQTCWWGYNARSRFPGGGNSSVTRPAVCFPPTLPRNRSTFSSFDHAKCGHRWFFDCNWQYFCKFFSHATRDPQRICAAPDLCHVHWRNKSMQRLCPHSREFQKEKEMRSQVWASVHVPIAPAVEWFVSSKGQVHSRAEHRLVTSKLLKRDLFCRSAFRWSSFKA